MGRVDAHPVFLFGLPVGPCGRWSKLTGAGRAGHGIDALHDGGRRAVDEVGNLAGVNVDLTSNVKESHARFALARRHFLLFVPCVLDDNGRPGSVDRRRDAVGSEGPARAQKNGSDGSRDVGVLVGRRAEGGTHRSIIELTREICGTDVA